EGKTGSNLDDGPDYEKQKERQGAEQPSLSEGEPMSLRSNGSNEIKDQEMSSLWEAQATNDSNVPPLSCSRSSSRPGGSNKDLPGPNSRLSEGQTMSRSLSSLQIEDSDIEVISKSQCR
ncbi:hypothetical protein NPIL_520481, partial [Nephila pilipes]